MELGWVGGAWGRRTLVAAGGGGGRSCCGTPFRPSPQILRHAQRSLPRVRCLWEATSFWPASPFALMILAVSTTNFAAPPQEPDALDSLKMEVGIEDCLHIEFEYDKSAYHLQDVVIGKVRCALDDG